MEDVPFMAIGADELGEELSEEIECPHCNGAHLIEYGEEVMKDGTKVPSKLLSFYKCGDKTYLAGIKGRKIKR